MMKLIFFNFLFALIAINAAAQGLQAKTGEQFPDIPIQNLINAPLKSVALSKPQNKIYILNIWGTWCSPCLPEMDTLAKLQLANPNTIQVIGLSDDTPERLNAYLKKKPSKIWLASDTAGFFYDLFALAYVGQSIIVNPKGKIVALVKSDSINQQMINKLIKGETVKSSGETKKQKMTGDGDPFAVDSTLTHNFTLRGYMQGQPAGSKRYLSNGAYKNRRISFTNATILGLYKAAFDIVSQRQVAFELPEKEVTDYENKETLYSLDLLVKPEQKDSLMAILQKYLSLNLPVKARIEYREMPVYALVNKNFKATESAKSELSYGFSGRGYDGTGVRMADFADDYLSNEFSLPVVDETGLNKRYDIKTNVELRSRDGIMKSINDIGLALEEKNKKMKVLVFYK
ncbi:redoxin domain-containing protein [Pedobacter aquatilis]|uniref:redoxin domain-containing protein n=1 Tax=Pedobacter aquatilis TaxID=351343 RepID=UPI00292F9A66|nr:redoxin domain-containing protein [Pedobacter aquatilis]